MGDFYEVSATEKVKTLEDEMRKELAELRNEIEENEMIHGIQRSISSVPIPRDVEYFKQERKIVVDKAMQVSEARPLVIQADSMQEELNIAQRNDYTPESLPLLLHQFFIDRMHQLVQAKHMHMLRWKRFCEHTSTIEALYPLYQKRLAHIMSEYNDCMARAQRLSVCRESFLSNNNNGALAIKVDDLLIYLRWLICHLHSVKKINQYLRVLEWLPVIHKAALTPGTTQKVEDYISNTPRIPSRYQDDPLTGGGSSAHSRPTSAASVRSVVSAPPPAPPPINPIALSTNPLPASQFAAAAAAAGGGLAADENNMNLPLLYNDLETLTPHLRFFVNMYNLSVDIDGISSTADEMELYAAVNRKFRQVFSRQEHMKTFKMYDKLEIGQENWGADSCQHALKQESNWLPFITLKPEKDPHQERKMVELRTQNNIDEILKAMARFLQVTDGEKVQDVLRNHATAVRDLPQVQAVSVTSNRTNYHTGVIWKRIYTNPELFKTKEDADEIAIQEFDEREADNVNFGYASQRSRAHSARGKRRDSYDYFDTVQLLGLDEGEQDSNDPASIQGGFLSFLQLRHLRIRDLQRTCLSIFNYCRSVERTLTINDGGLSLESGKMKSVSPQNHRKSVVDGGLGGGGGLGSHQYIHNTPRDFKISEVEFMEFSEIENHDDFYTVEEGRVHVQDQRGYYIMYDTALQDFQDLENDLLLIATHFMEKDRDLRHSTGIQRTESAKRRMQTEQAGDFSIPTYGHSEVDRFAVLLDLWTHEAAYLECKKELMDCYVEAYHHVFDRDEKRALAQAITNIAHKRPRFDFAAPYFVRTYRLECICLRHQTNLVKNILDKQMEEQREYIGKVTREGDHDYGLPHKIIPKQPIAVNMSRSALRNVYMLEFHPSLALAAHLPQALAHAYWEVYHVQKPETVTDSILLEKKMLELAQKDWDKMDALGGSFSLQVQKDVFSDVFVEDPLFMCEIAQSNVHQQDLLATRKSQKEKQLAMIKEVAKLMQVVTLRYRLLDACWESEVLSKVYKKLAVDMGFDECHLFLRFVQFEFASHKEDAGKPPPVFITAIQEDDSSVDRYTPNYLYLAIHELDESHVGRFSFRSRDGLLQILKGSGVETLMTVLMAQVTHKNALICGVQQANECQPVKEDPMGKIGRPLSPVDTKSEKSSLTATTAMSSGTQGTLMLGSKLKTGDVMNRRSPEAFMSIQLEKVPSRDMMTNEFILKKSQMGTILRNPEEMEKLKRKLINEYCQRFNCRVAQFSLRGQIIATYNSILGLLEDFKNIRDTYFMMGEINEKKTAMDDLRGLKPDPRKLTRRPRRVLSPDGKHVLNIWFVPHHSEILIMYKTMDDESCRQALVHHLQIVSALHDILQYLCAHAKLGSSHARLGSKKMEFVSADWGGTEGIGADLREIQKQLNHLSQPTSPSQVANFLMLRRDVMFLEFDTAVRHSMRDTFLSTGNKPAFKAITECMHFALHNLSNAQRPSVFATYLNVPEPLEAKDTHAQLLFPWRAFIGRDGPYPIHFWQWQQIGYYMQLCLAGLKDVDRHVANGEILGVSLLMEDVLLSGQQDQAIFMSASDSDDEGDETASNPGSVASRPASKMSRAPSAAPSRPQSSSIKDGSEAITSKEVAPKKQHLSRTQEPIESHQLLRTFLLLWKQLMVFKLDWGKRKLLVEAIDNTTTFANFCKEYKKDVLFPVLQSVARRYGQADLYEGMVSDLEPLVAPKGASEMEIRIRQLIKLLEMLEVHMINEVRRKLAKELALVLAERGREESALPTDLWKRPTMKESFTINKPHIAEDFIELLMAECTEKDQELTFSREHLNSCLSTLASEVMIRERHNYDSYTMYYENLLRVQHQLLYQREQETKQLRDQLQTSRNNTLVEVQVELANTSHDLLLEITALRAKIAEMRHLSVTQQRDIRERVREEYNSLTQNLFSSAFELKAKFDEFREHLHNDVKDKISETRREAIEAMTRLKERSGTNTGFKRDDEFTRQNLVHADQMQLAQHENHELATLMMKMKAFGNWKQNHMKVEQDQSIAELKKNAERIKKDNLEIKMMAEEEVILLRQQQVALRNALKASEQECAELKKELEKELKDKKENLHTLQQKAQSQKQLEEARKANIEKLIDDLGEKDGKLQQMADEQDKNRKLQSLMAEKVRKDILTVKRQLTHERSLKLGAFQRVDELQTQIYDIESGIMSRPQTAIGCPSAGADRAKSRTSSGKSRTRSRGGNWPPPVSWPANRSPTPGYDLSGTPNNEVGKIQRPKTTVGRLRSRLADQLLNELDPPDHHETLIRIKELQAKEKTF